jgi:hypothetical protein
MVSVGSEAFLDRLVESSPCGLLLVVHDSLFVLAGIKEKHDKVKCWQGELIYVPDKWAPLDVVFLYFLPAVPFNLGQVFGALAKCFSPGDFHNLIYFSLHPCQCAMLLIFNEVSFIALDSWSH